jgi:ATP-dependent Clp protease ATP-binding subunit ClpX
VELVFTEEALQVAAEKALDYKTGARGLRTIIEQVLLDTMFEIPSLRNVRRCEITKEVILGEEKPALTYWSETA